MAIDKSKYSWANWGTLSSKPKSGASSAPLTTKTYKSTSWAQWKPTKSKGAAIPIPSEKAPSSITSLPQPLPKILPTQQSNLIISKLNSADKIAKYKAANPAATSLPKLPTAKIPAAKLTLNSDKAPSLPKLSSLKVQAPATKMELNNSDQYKAVSNEIEGLNNAIINNPIRKALADTAVNKFIMRTAQEVDTNLNRAAGVDDAENETSKPDLGPIANTLANLIGFGMTMKGNFAGVTGPVNNIETSLAPVGRTAGAGAAKLLSKFEPALPAANTLGAKAAVTASKVANYVVPTVAKEAAEGALFGASLGVGAKDGIVKETLNGAAMNAGFGLGLKGLGSVAKGITHYIKGADGLEVPVTVVKDDGHHITFVDQQGNHSQVQKSVFDRVAKPVSVHEGMNTLNSRVGDMPQYQGTFKKETAPSEVPAAGPVKPVENVDYTKMTDEELSSNMDSVGKEIDANINDKSPEVQTKVMALAEHYDNMAREQENRGTAKTSPEGSGAPEVVKEESTPPATETLATEQPARENPASAPTTRKDLQKHLEYPDTHEHNVNDDAMFVDHLDRPNSGKITKVNADGSMEIETLEGDTYKVKKVGNTLESYTEGTPKDQIKIEDRQDADKADLKLKKVKPYQELHPELKSYIQHEAAVLQAELKETTRGEHFVGKLGHGELKTTGLKRVTSSSIARLRDEYDIKYRDIEIALKNIIEDHDSENTLVAKRIEALIDERLKGGYSDMSGQYETPPNKEYIKLMEQIDAAKPAETPAVKTTPAKVKTKKDVIAEGAKGKATKTNPAKYRYYLAERPPSLGTHPKGTVDMKGFDNKTDVPEIGGKAWGYVEYDHPLTDKQVSDYELKPAPGIDLQTFGHKAETSKNPFDEPRFHPFKQADEFDAQFDRKTKWIEDTIKDQEAVKFSKEGSNQYLIFHPSTKGNKYQLTIFDDKGAIMDSQSNDLQDAVDFIMREGYGKTVDESIPKGQSVDLQTFGRPKGTKAEPPKEEINVGFKLELREKGDKATSKFYSNSLKKSEWLPEDVDRLVKEADHIYTKHTNVGDLEKAASVIRNNGINDEIDRLLKKPSLDDSIDTMEHFLITNELMAQAKATGRPEDYNKVTRWLHYTNSKITGAAQALQAVSVVKKSTPAGMLTAAEKGISKAVEKIEAKNPKLKKQVDDKATEVKKAMDDINKEASDTVGKDITDNIDQILEKGRAEVEAKRKAAAAKKNAAGKKVVKPAPGKEEPIVPLTEAQKRANAAEVLARKVDNATKPKTPKEMDVEAEMVKTLFRVAKKNLPETEKIPQDPLQFVAMAIKGRDKYKDVWRKAQNILQEAYRNEPEKLEILQKYLDDNLKPTFEKDKMEKVISKKLKDMGVNLGQIVKEHYTVNKQMKVEIKERLIREAGLSGEDANILGNYIAKRMKELTNDKKMKVLERLMADKETVKGTPKSPVKSIQELSNLGAFNNTNYTGKIVGKVSPLVDKIIKSKLDIGKMVKSLSMDKQELTKVKVLNHILEQTNLARSDAEKLAQIVLDRFDELSGIAREKAVGSKLDKIKFVGPKPKVVANPVKSIQELSNLGAFNNKNYLAEARYQLGIESGKMIAEKIDLGKMVRLLSQEDQNLTRERIINYILQKTDLNVKDASILSKVVKERFDELAGNKKETILKGIFEPKKPAKQTSMIEKIVELSHLGAFDHADYKGLISDKYGIPSLTADDAKFIAKTMERAQAMPEGRARDIEVARAVMFIANKLPKTMEDKIKSLQRISMLLSPKTMLRNVFGNVFMGTAETIKDVPGALVDKAISKYGVPGMLKPTRERTTLEPSLNSLATSGKAIKQGFKNVTEDRKLGIDTSPGRGQYEIPMGKVFNEDKVGGKLLNKLDSMTKYGLQYGDSPFYNAAYKEYLRQQMKIAKVTHPTDAMIKKAHAIAEERTFQNITEISKGFEGLRKSMNRIGSKVAGNENFGLGNIVVPFIKTPANILDKAIDYSPVSAIKAINMLRTAKNTGTFDQKHFCDTVGRGVTGTAAILLGYHLASKGWLVGHADTNTNVAALDKSTGKSPYSFHVGDMYYTFDWAQPMSLPFAIGADVFQNGHTKQQAMNIVVQAVQSGGQTLLNQTVFAGITKFMSGYDLSSNIASTVAGFPTQFAPTFLKQIAQLTDTTQRSSYEDNVGASTLNTIKAKLPGLSRTLEPKVDTLGKEVKLFQGSTNPVTNFINTFLNPGTFTAAQTNQAVDLVKNIYEKTGETKQFPKVAAKYFDNTDGERINLTAKEYTAYQKYLGQHTMDYISTLSDSGLSSEDDYLKLANKISNEITKINKDAKDEILSSRGLDTSKTALKKTTTSSSSSTNSRTTTHKDRVLIDGASRRTTRN